MCVCVYRTCGVSALYHFSVCLSVCIGLSAGQVWLCPINYRLKPQGH